MRAKQVKGLNVGVLCECMAEAETRELRFRDTESRVSPVWVRT